MLEIRYQLYRSLPIQLYLETAVMQSGSFENDYYKVKSGNGWRAAFTAQQNFESYSLFSKIFFKYAKVPVSNVEFSQREAGLVLGVICEL